MILAVLHRWRLDARWRSLWRRLRIGLLAGLGLAPVWGLAQSADPSVALHYGAQPPWRELAAFDWVVLEPAHHGDLGERRRAAPHTRFFAYVSVGEVHRQHRHHDQIPPDWRIGANRAWNSAVIDQRVADWPRWFVEHIARPQWERGYRGFFLDTLDAYHLVAKTPEERAAHEAGLVRVVQALRAAFPEAKLILNRGFEILPQVAAQGHAHFSVRKQASDGVTRSALHVLTNQERVGELARMLGGVQVTEASLAHARQMLDDAQQP